MSEGSLNKVDRCTAVEGVAGVSVSQPMGTHRAGNASLLGRLAIRDGKTGSSTPADSRRLVMSDHKGAGNAIERMRPPFP